MIEPVDWRRNLVALWFAEFTAIFGFSFAFPFLPLFLRELGVRDPGQLAIYTGITGGASGLALAIMSPIWGILADRYGRKAMLVRAMILGGITVGLLGLARGPIDLIVLRLLQGGTSGTVAAATALVATGTPRGRVGWALGVLSSSVAVGGALGPSVGGLAASVFGLRALFVAGGVLLLVAAIPVVIVVTEAPLVRRDGPRLSLAETLRRVGAGTVAAIATLVACQALLQSSFSGFQPLVVLRLLEHVSSGVAAVTGLAFAASGLASALAAIFYAGVARRLGYRGLAVLCALLLAGAQALTGFGPTVPLIVLGAALGGAFYGALGPSLSAMIGLETPAEAQARVFGFSSSAVAVGFAAGPLGGGLLASRTGPGPAIGGAALVAVILAGVLALRAREPAR